jgi:hypothetical protein
MWLGIECEIPGSTGFVLDFVLRNRTCWLRVWYSWWKYVSGLAACEGNGCS